MIHRKLTKVLRLFYQQSCHKPTPKQNLKRLTTFSWQEAGHEFLKGTFFTPFQKQLRKGIVRMLHQWAESRTSRLSQALIKKHSLSPDWAAHGNICLEGFQKSVGQ